MPEVFSVEAVEKARILSSMEASSSSGHAAATSAVEGLPASSQLPQYILDDIANRMEDAKENSILACVSKEWKLAASNVSSLRITVLNDYHDRARNNESYQGKSFKSFEGAGSSRSLTGSMIIKEWIPGILKGKHNIVQLRIEVEVTLQSKTVSEAERRRTDFWITDPYHVSKWLPFIEHTLKHLCIVDYGQQAIMRRSKIVKLLSEHCLQLKTLDLRNLFIDTSDCAIMTSMVSLTLRCVKVVSETLNHINVAMPNLQTLALLGVFGAEGGSLTLQHLTVLCLGLSTPATDVTIECPELEKLQLKMQCPHKLIIRARKLRYVAFNMDVVEDSRVEMISMVGLKELLYGATSFATLTSLIDKNMRNLEKVFLDIPCMALAEDGRFLGVLKDTTMVLPDFSKLHECKNLDVLNIGPGLWHSLETQVRTLQRESSWPSMKNLVLHMIPHDMEAAIIVLRMLLREFVRSLLIFIHESSPMTEELMTPKIEGVVRDCEQVYNHDIKLVIQPWKKHLNFACFSF